MKPIFARTEDMAEQLGISVSCLKRWRPEMIEGVHYSMVNLRVTLYNVEMVLDWIANRHDPQAHQQAVERYVKALPSNRSKRDSVSGT